ncbi:MAG: DUF6220 domain-containing protein [Cyanobacteria bacterium J06636_16]
MHSSSDPIDAVGQSPTDQLPNSISRDNPFSSKSPTIVFYILAVLFNLCLTIQLLTVGLAFFHDPAWWQNHTWLVRGYSGLSLILLVWAYKIALPRRIRIFTVSFPILLGLQFLTIHVQTPLPLPLAIVHPLIGFALFYASTTLVHRTWKILHP